jgi:hypothetical protein
MARVTEHDAHPGLRHELYGEMRDMQDGNPAPEVAVRGTSGETLKDWRAEIGDAPRSSSHHGLPATSMEVTTHTPPQKQLSVRPLRRQVTFEDDTAKAAPITPVQSGPGGTREILTKIKAEIQDIDLKLSGGADDNRRNLNTLHKTLEQLKLASNRLERESREERDWDDKLSVEDAVQRWDARYKLAMEEESESDWEVTRDRGTVGDWNGELILDPRRGRVAVGQWKRKEPEKGEGEQSAPDVLARPGPGNQVADDPLPGLLRRRATVEDDRGTSDSGVASVGVERLEPQQDNGMFHHSRPALNFRDRPFLPVDVSGDQKMLELPEIGGAAKPLEHGNSGSGDELSIAEVA